MAKRKKLNRSHSSADPSAPNRSKLRTTVFIAVTLAAISLLGLLAAELVCRQWIPPSPPPGREQNVFLCQPATHPDMVFMLKPNQQFVTFGLRSQTNELGFRDDPISEKTESLFRILCVGDSITFGTGVANEETFPNVLEDLLRNRIKEGTEVDVINGAVSAYNARNISGLLSLYLESLHPDLVVYTFVENDLDDSMSAGAGGFLVDYDPDNPADSPFIMDDYPGALLERMKVFRGIKNRSAIRQMLFQKLSGVTDVSPPLLVGDHPLTHVRWKSFEEEMVRMKQLCEEAESGFAVYTFGTENHSEPVNRRVREICKRLDIPEASTNPLFNHSEYMKKYSLGFDPHLNPDGHSLMAERLLAFLAAEDLLPTEWFSDLAEVAEAFQRAALDWNPKEFVPPSRINPPKGKGLMGIIGGIDASGRMARSCFVRLGGEGNAIEVEAEGFLDTRGKPQSLAAIIEGVTAAERFTIPRGRTTCLFPIPPEYSDAPVEVELRVSGPCWIPKPEQRLKGASPQSIQINEIRRR